MVLEACVPDAAAVFTSRTSPLQLFPRILWGRQTWSHTSLMVSQFSRLAFKIKLEIASVRLIQSPSDEVEETRYFCLADSQLYIYLCVCECVEVFATVSVCVWVCESMFVL